MVVTTNPHAWFICTNNSGKTQTVYNDETPEHNYPFAFESNFSDSASPPVNKVTLYNMSKKHAMFYAKGFKVKLAFNWGAPMKIISEGYITKIDTMQHDGVTDTLVITYTEGTNYNNVKARRLKVKKNKDYNKYKHVKVTKTYKRGKKKGQQYTVNHRVKTRATKTVLVNKTYKAGTSYKDLIQGVASQAGMHIDKIQLHKNPKLKKAYTAKGKPLTLIKQMVKKTESEITYERGKFEIIDPKSDKRTWVTIDDQDLVQPPSSNQSDDGGDDTWEITTPLIPEITVRVGIEMKSKYLKGKFWVKAGQHTSDGTNPQTQCSLVAL
ncbi:MULTISPECIES: hypothetical protein [Lactobacillus]|uniref:Uncharacterized protein n=1 Tax=Lactobacillus xujianguonis TaxID=2495899 RepID=A0A437SSR7_9LACO|nr:MULTISPECIES: hypothetical protein [Lactobacillus]RVU69935.1 hypothetical protein EJK17_10405 [Lactobacillus xujianguonis]RVU73462.1 hypothetical protein EJK20_08250 [Lactobacillus xujianguonis]